MGGWWFVCLVLVATYTASLTAIFAAQTTESGFNSIDELVSKIPPVARFGTYNNSQMSDFFKHSPIRTYQEAYGYMEMESLLFNTESEAISAVLNDRIALIDDSPIVDFISSRKDNQKNPNCTLRNIGDGLFNPAGYGLGLAKNSPFTDDFSLAILELRETGVIEELTTEYFQHRRTCVSETAMHVEGMPPISLESVGGLFILLGTGVLLSFVILAIELTCARILGKAEPLVPQANCSSTNPLDNDTEETAGTNM